MSPCYFVEAFHEEVNLIKENWKALEMDIGQVKMKPIMESMLGAKGEYSVSIIPEAVNLSVSLNVSMDAKDLAVAIASGNKDTQGFFETTHLVDRAALDLDGGGA